MVLKLIAIYLTCYYKFNCLVLGRDRFFIAYICFKEKLYKYFFLPQNTCQYRVPVKK